MSRATEPAGVGALGIAAAIAAAATSLIQPLAPQVVADMASPRWAAALLTGAPPFGYMLGLAVLVPQSHKRSARALAGRQLIGLAIALGLAAAAHSIWTLATSMVLAGALATAAALCVLAAGRLHPARRGRVVGRVATALGLGVVLGRVAAGVLAGWFGWRGALACAAVGAAFAAAWLSGGARDSAVATEGARPQAAGPVRWGQVARSLGAGTWWFAAFSAFWGTIPYHLARPPFSLGPTALGLFSLAAAAGAFGARAGGVAADRWGARATIGIGMAVSAAGAVLASRSDLGVMLAGALMLDVGCFMAQAANQARVIAAAGDRDGPGFSLYMTGYYAAGAVGAFVGPLSLDRVGWGSVCAVITLGFGIATLFG